jgi:hypothetical protein
MDNKTKFRLQKLAGIDEIKINTPSFGNDASSELALELTAYIPITIRYYSNPDEGGPIPNYTEDATDLEYSEFLKIASQNFDQVLKNAPAAESAFFNMISDFDNEDLIDLVEAGLEKVEDLEVKLYRGKNQSLSKIVKFEI